MTRFSAHPAARNVGDYRKLIVWQRASVFSRRIREMVDELPPAERRRIGDQLIRAAESIRFNIAEGAGLNSDRQLARHLLIALGSANEVQDGLDALNESSILPIKYADLPGEATEIRSMLAVFHRRVAKEKQKSPR
jgi:four helix bundle protein